MRRVPGVRGVLTAMVLAAGVPTVTSATPASAQPDPHWVASWAASPTDSSVPFDATGLPLPEALAGQTLRMMVTPHLAGSVLRIHLSNRFGKQATTFGHVTVG